MIDLKNKVAIVTGSARGIGRAISEQLIRAGCNVAVADINAEAACSTAAQIARDGARTLSFGVDVTDPEAVKQMVATTVSEMGRLDILVNNAGVQSYVRFDDMSLEEWRRVIDINLTGMFVCCKAVAPIFEQQHSGRIINMASMSARTGGQASPPNYTSSKAGVVGLTKAMARTLAPYNVTVNALAPGIIDTDMIGHWSDELRRSWEAQIPLGRLGTALDVANAVVFFASDMAGYITGVTLDVNGGYYIC